MTNDRTARTALLAVALAVLSACEATPPPTAPEVRPVRYARVTAAGALETETFSGVVQAELETDLSFKVNGTLIELPVALGDRLEANELIGRLDPTDYRVQLEEAEAGLAQARAQERNAAASYERVRGLYENRNASRSDLDSARAAFESARASVSAARQRLEAAELQLSYTRLRSPAACTVARLAAEVNQNVQAGQPIARVNCGDCPEVVINVPEIYIERIRSGMEATVSIAAVNLQAVTGTVSEVGVATGPRGATYPVTVSLGEGCAAARSGMAAEAKLALPATGDRGELMVPTVAVGEDRQGRFVFVLEPADDDTDQYVARRRAVQTGRPDPDGMVIIGGLSTDELVVTAGVRRIADGQRVRLLDGQ
jgi:RND family efflux transporter MFP subunit